MLRTSLLALTMLASAVLPASAQLRTEPPEPYMREILATPYADRLLKTLVGSVRRHADPACLQAKGLDDAALADQGRAILQRYGVRFIQILDDGIDRTAYQAALSASAGADAAAEIERLQSDPNVKQLIALGRPAQLARMLDMVLEQFDRHVLIARIKLDPVSPIARGEPAPPEDPSEAASLAEQEFLDKTDSPQLDRYLELSEAAEAAIKKSVRREKAVEFSAKLVFGGVEKDLAELCIGPREPKPRN